MTTARDNRRRKAKARKKLAKWRAPYPVRATGKTLDRFAHSFGTYRLAWERRDKPLRRRIINIVRAANPGARP